MFLAAIMVISMIAVGFAAPAAATTLDTADRSLDATDVSPGSTVQVTVSGELTGPTQVLTISETFAPEFVDVSLDSYSLDGESVSLAEPTITEFNNDGVDFVHDGNGEAIANSSYELVYTATVVDQEATHAIENGSVSATDLNNETNTVDLTDTSVTVSDGGGDDTPSDGTFTNRDEANNGDVGVLSGNVVFQGEEDISFVDENGDEVVSASELEGTSGSREGTPLQMPIPTDEETGTYAVGGPDAASDAFRTTVVEPRITTAEIQLNGDDIEQIAASRATAEADGTNSFGIAAEYNFQEAEDVTVEVQDPSGADITDEVLVEGEDDLIDDGGFISLDMSSEDAGEYTIVFEGNNNLDYGDVIEEYTLELTNQDTVELGVDEDSVTQGDNLDYTISGAIDGDYHLVTIDAADFRDGISEGDNIFRNVEDTSATGFASDTAGDLGNDPTDADYAYAVVEIDGTQGVGSIETANLDDSSIDFEVYPPEGTGDFYDRPADTEDDVEFDVEEGDVTLDSPTDSYVVGSEVDVSGTAESADEVRLYAKDNDDWEIVEVDGEYIIDVDSDDTFEETDINLRDGDGPGNNILAFEGRYEIGVIAEADAAQADADNGNDLANSVITTSQWTTATSSRDSINVVEGDLTAEFVTYDGQIASEDSIIDVNGTAAGQDNVVVAFVDDRGNTLAYSVSVDDDDTFDEEDLGVGLNQGSVSAHVISNGRDGNIGDGDLPDNDNSIGGLVQFIEDLGDNNQLSGDQVRDRIVTETVEDDASDDLIVTQTFRLNDGTVSLDAVYPEGSEASGINPVAAGDTMVVEGTTNRKADDNSIVIDILDEDGNSLATESTEMWGADGMYTVNVDTSDLETGTYTIEADTGDNTDRETVEIVESIEEDTEEEATNETDTEEETTEEETTEEETTEEESTEEETTEEETTEEESTEEESTDDSTPGFGALVALVALVAAALLATRRRDE